MKTIMTSEIFTNAIDLAKFIMKLGDEGVPYEIEIVNGIGHDEKVVKVSYDLMVRCRKLDEKEI